jgi:hypothetical protein
LAMIPDSVWAFSQDVVLSITDAFEVFGPE